MDISAFIKNNFLILDGGMGTLLQAKGLVPGERPETWNILHPDVITDIHLSYYNAGSNVVSTNTFGANIINFKEEELEKIIVSAVKNARNASRGKLNRFVAFDVGPLGKMLAPYGDLDFEDAVSIFRKSIALGLKEKVDLVFIETMTDCYETKAALLAAKEAMAQINVKIPVFVSNAYEKNGRLMTGSDPESVISMLEAMGADAVGVNCSFGPASLMPVIEKYLEYASVPVLFKPNAGLPAVVDGKTAFDVSPSEFASVMKKALQKGVRIAGGCCGTTFEYIKALKNEINDLRPVPLTKKNISCVSSGIKTVFFDKPVLIGERINPTGKKRFRQAVQTNDIAYILKEAVKQTESGAHVLDVNVGIPEIDESVVLPEVVKEIQVVSDLPLQMDTTNVNAMEKALRVYNGKALINSVNGKKDVMESIFPLAVKYGAMVVALTLDENGIPSTAAERVAIVDKILDKAHEYGLDKKDILFDPLAMAVSADSKSALQTLETVRILKDKGCLTSLGISNISFGLPQRESVNGTFFAMALENGLSAAIMNPYSRFMNDVFHSFCVLSGKDSGCVSYIKYCEQNIETAPVSAETKTTACNLGQAIAAGLKEEAVSIAKSMISDVGVMDIIEKNLIPALDEVGRKYEQGILFLPQLLSSAEASSAVFDAVRQYSEKGTGNGFKIVLATVKGDIHDIGKNIVHMLLENYGFSVIDLGKDVPPEKILDAVIENNAGIAGLSALMTTTLPSMEKTIALLREKAPWCRTVVGGAVLTQEYADKTGASHYAKDAMSTVRFADKILKSNT